MQQLQVGDYNPWQGLLSDEQYLLVELVQRQMVVRRPQLNHRQSTSSRNYIMYNRLNPRIQLNDLFLQCLDFSLFKLGP
jgi:hypothetical protein